MNKRIRKKKCKGEFQELAFEVKAKYAKLTEEDADKLVSELIEKAFELGMKCGGSFELDGCSLFVVTGQIKTGEEERKQKFVEFMKALPGMESVEAGEFFDAWYTPVEHEDGCDCGCHEHA